MKNTCRKQIQDRLVREIRSGAYFYGDDFHGVNTLMTKFSVSYVTACRILRSLANEGYLICRSRAEGYKVCYVGAEQAQASKKVNFIACSATSGFGCELFLTGKELFEENGWDVHLHEMAEPVKIERLHEILNEPEAYSVIAGLNVPWQRFIATLKHLENRVLIIGRISKNDNISTVVCDEQDSVRRIIDYLISVGRSRPALVVHDANSELENIRMAAWRNALTSIGVDFNWIMEHIWCNEEPGCGVSESAFYQRILEKYGNEIDSIVVPSGVRNYMQAISNMGNWPSDKVLPVTIGCIADKSFYERYGACYLDNNPRGHLELALRIMEFRYESGKRERGYWLFCHPGEIVAPKSDRGKGEPNFKGRGASISKKTDKKTVNN